MDCLAHVAVILRAIIACHQDVRTDRQTDKDVNEKINKGTGRADCSQRLAACKTPHHDHICRIEKKLKHTGKHQRNGVCKYLSENRTIAHIHFIGFRHVFHPFVS